MSNRSKKHQHHHSEVFNGLLGPLMVLAEPVFDVATATLTPCIFATLPDGRAVDLEDIHFGHNSCMECEAAAGVREDYPFGNREEYQQEIAGSLFFGLKAGDTILVSADQDSDSPNNVYMAHVCWQIVDGIARRTQGPEAHRERAKPALVS